MNDVWVLIAFVCAAAVMAIIIFVRDARSQRIIDEQLAVMRRMQSDIHALCAGAINMGNHIESLEYKLRRVAERQEQLEARDPIQQTYAHAIRLAQKGAGVDDLVENCGLAQGEAELLMRLHRVERRQAVSA
jgi:hypothetical protein